MMHSQNIRVKLVQFWYLVDLEVVFDDLGLAMLSSIASLGQESRASVVSVSLGPGSRRSAPSLA